ncbi:Cyclic di-GMP phosphodiesterase response regulator RpfG [Gimesia alba]|uniref:Cyclic di-GMP phosphodiesterase response regulator RpfG n=1 Tax=Gimesia alba TaxID=2527973 RepID=A0A517RLE2_9PLAN|nr:HD domain-containing phosphohydrolase [Gimesia alba]QDT44695.1 Cyclic di-GMP phosphodiesterase response regulator RpfG [Gimesia alba]
MIRSALDSPSTENKKTFLDRNGFEQCCIAIIDDESINIDMIKYYLEMEGFSNLISTDKSASAFSMIQSEKPDLVLSDIKMPDVSGLDLLAQIRGHQEFATTPVIILTATSDNETKISALKQGATDLLAKPIHHGELIARIRNVLNVKIYQDQLKANSETLEEAVRQRTAELEASRLSVIQCLARAAEFRDDDTGQHVIRVGKYARIIGAELGLSERELCLLEPAAQLHDVGKIGVEDSILLKPGKLTPEEYDEMKRHCGFGKKIVDCLPEREAQLIRMHTEMGAKIMDIPDSPILNLAKIIAMTHHERWDGSGYPLGLSGEDIPLEGRITAVADVFDALMSKRSYKPAFPLAKSLEILEEGRGTQFDPSVLDAFTKRRQEIIQIQIDYAETD